MVRILLSTRLGERRLTQADLSRMTGIRKNTISELYHELATRISLEHLDLICEALDCGLTDLLEITPNPEPRVKTRSGAPRTGRRKGEKKHVRQNQEFRRAAFVVCPEIPLGLGVQRFLSPGGGLADAENQRFYRPISPEGGDAGFSIPDAGDGQPLQRQVLFLPRQRPG